MLLDYNFMVTNEFVDVVFVVVVVVVVVVVLIARHYLGLMFFISSGNFFSDLLFYQNIT